MISAVMWDYIHKQYGEQKKDAGYNGNKDNTTNINSPAFSSSRNGFQR